jgi:hypothetical protein
VNTSNGKAKRVIYTITARPSDGKVFSDVDLPNGVTIRRVDANVHREALKNASKAVRKAS